MNTNDISRLAGLVAEPARTRMLVDLIDGRALTAGELARSAGIAASTASRHLAQLVDGGLIVVVAQGRHRYHRLASAEVAAVIEALMQVAGAEADIAGPARRAPPRTGPRDARLRRMRTCFDHLAGRLGVAITDHLVDSGAIELGAGSARATSGLAAELGRIGLVVAGGANATACRPCLDWAERRPHLAGPLAVRLCRHLIEQDWLRRPAGGRGLEPTGDGSRQLGNWLGARRWRAVIEEG